MGTISHTQNNEVKIDSTISSFIKKEKINDYFYKKDYCTGCNNFITVKDSIQCYSNGTNFSAYLFCFRM